ncbi:diaminopimelate decarboxylase [Aureibacillus halotolerans]|uniref:Diaminopimelate decarboxylase n=1 Tax=Aureibacillus halotolerans TaxID=1508390 RepID=A0A4R6U9E0_9BACI|nr:diaminopimelate decarboxylase [Aureibacillus halotolerans]TDQ41593.1 diaminopimelate decarboxylase [Aureibacillus halotolerans]
MARIYETNKEGHLTIGGLDALDLADTFQTPVIVYDVAKIRNEAQEMHHAFQKRNLSYQIAYASKAFSCKAMVQLAEEEGLSLDVVSGGELHTALLAGFPTERIHFHGNNKSEAELKMAIEANIGCVVLDNHLEIQWLQSLCNEANATMNVLLRVTPGIEAHTHDYILTGQEDSKFGFDLQSGQANAAFEAVNASSRLCFKGLHCHIGSQIFEATGFTHAAEKLIALLSEWKVKYNQEAEVLNIGGGFGIRYTDEDTPMPIGLVLGEVLDYISSAVLERGLAMPEVWIEPGRSLVGEAATTLYTLGSRKDIPGIRTYVSVDGGMSDNLRPALYQAKYDAALAERPNAGADETVSIAGKCCETGDMLIWDVALPQSSAGDILAVPSTGAYGYSMANHYNRNPRPAVVFIENGEAFTAIRRETYEDLTQFDLTLRNYKKTETTI